MSSWSLLSSSLVAKPAIELGWSIVNGIIETSTKCTGGKEKMILALKNKEVCMEAMVFLWEFERP